MIAEDLMSPRPVTVRATAKVREAVALLQGLDIRHLPVVDDRGALVGMLSDRDLRGLALPYVVGGEYVGTVQTGLEAPVRSVMTTDVLSVARDADVSVIIDLMLDHRIGAVPVLDPNDGLVGIVSYMDVLRGIELPEE